MANSIFSRRAEETVPIRASGGLSPAASVGYNSHRALTASAVRVNLTNKREIDAITKRRQTETWQADAWEYYDLIGEVKYAANLVASTTSRVNLYAGYVERSSDVPSAIEQAADLDPEFVRDAADILYMLESGNGGTAGLLRTAALNLFIAGECWLVREPSTFSTGEPDRYQIRSVEELVTVSGRNARVAIKPTRESKPADYINLPTSAYAARIWRNHPRYSGEADSSLRGILDICDQLLLLDRAASASAKSRMNAGLLFLPDELSNAADTDDEMVEDGASIQEANEELEETLIRGWVSPVEDIDSVASVTPTIIRGPEDAGEKIRYITFERATDPQHNARADRLLERILGGLDIPKDVASGMSSVKYSNAIIIEEQLYKAHIEPLILMICDALTIGFLRPALRAQGWEEKLVSRAVVWYDPTAITAKPSKAEASLTLYQMKLLGADAVRRANGFAPGDGPTELERVQRLAEERAIIPDGLSETLLDTLLPEDLKQASRENALANSDPESANALNQALGGEAPAGEEITEDTTGAETPETQAPPTLMEP